MTKPRKARACDLCQHFAPDDATLCAKGHKPRLYRFDVYPYGEFKRRCEDFEERKIQPKDDQ